MFSCKPVSPSCSSQVGSGTSRSRTGSSRLRSTLGSPIPTVPSPTGCSATTRKWPRAAPPWSSSSTPGWTTTPARLHPANSASPAWSTSPGCLSSQRPSKPTGRERLSRSPMPAGSGSRSSSPRRPPTSPGRRSTAAGCPIPVPMTVVEIKEVVKAFGQAAKRAQTADFDMVEIHACHGYLISNFLSPHTNKRTDWYGGSLENRMRFLLESHQGDQGSGRSRLPHLRAPERHRLRARRAHHRRDDRAVQASGSQRGGGHPHVRRQPPHDHPRSEPHGDVAGTQRVGGGGGEKGGQAPGDRLGLDQPAQPRREHPGRGQRRLHRSGPATLGRPAVAAQGERRPAGGHPTLHPLQRRLSRPGRPRGQDRLLQR